VLEHRSQATTEFWENWRFLAIYDECEFDWILAHIRTLVMKFVVTVNWAWPYERNEKLCSKDEDMYVIGIVSWRLFLKSR
jgi:hypothetical protein